jgi:TRAP-type C4-dicarboxylate transport system substrate-binding protein
MNKAKYESLPPDLKKVIDNNSGQALSGQVGKTFLAADGIGKKLTEKNTHNVIPASELQSWKKAGEQISNDWVADVTAKGANGKLLLENARALIAKYAVK